MQNTPVTTRTMNISIIEDEVILATRIGKKLRQEGFVVEEYYSYESFMNTKEIESDLYIIDISL